MSAMLMRNYQKLIKIKKGPKVKDLLITVPCKSRIIHSRESEPNTTETGGKKTQRLSLAVGTNSCSLYVLSWQRSISLCAQCWRITFNSHCPGSKQRNKVACGGTDKLVRCSRTDETQDSRAGLQHFMRGLKSRISDPSCAVCQFVA